MTDRELSEDVIRSVSDGFFSVISDMFELDLKIISSKMTLIERFKPKGEAIVHIDYIGSVVGLVAISASPEVFGHCFELKSLEDSGLSSEDYFNELAGPLKECMNTVAGKCLPILAGHISCVSMLAPKVLYGNISYPKTPCLEKTVTTDVGDFSFYFLIDRMKLDTAKAIARLESTERSSKSVVESMGMLYKSLESTQLQVLSEVGDTISHIKNLKEFIDGKQEDGEEISQDAASALSNLKNTQDLMSKRLSDIVHDLNMFKGMLLHDLRVTKVRESDRLREVNLVGLLSENSNLDFFGDITEGHLVINVNNVYNHNDSGVRIWIKRVSACKKTLDIEYVRCSSHFLSISQMYPDFLGTGKVRSISAHYFCASCEFKEEFELHIDQIDTHLEVPKVECNCGNDMELWEGCDQSGLVNFLSDIQ